MELFFVFLRFKINPCEVICSKACKNGPGKICGRQLLKNLISPLLNILSHFRVKYMYLNKSELQIEVTNLLHFDFFQ